MIYNPKSIQNSNIDTVLTFSPQIIVKEGHPLKQGLLSQKFDNF